MNTKTMNKQEFTRMLAGNKGAAETMQEILELARADGYNDGFSAGYEASASENDIYDDGV